MWTTTKDLDRWYILNVNVQGVHGRSPRQSRYRKFPLASEYQVICGSCTWDHLTPLHMKVVEAKRRVTGGQSDIEWLRWLTNFIINNIRRHHEEFIVKMACKNKRGKRIKWPTAAQIDARVERLYPATSTLDL